LPNNELNHRAQEIGRVLFRARSRAEKSLRECAEQIGTSRQRYANIERGKVYVGAVELEALMRYLEIRPEEIWPEDLFAMIRGEREIAVNVAPGEILNIKVIAEREAPSKRATR
jgi:transcriptional regulator with XRE-family HTH domain